MKTYTVSVVLHGSADHRPGNARSRLRRSLCQLRVLRGAHCDRIASLLNATGAIQHKYFDGSSPDQVFADQTVLSGAHWPHHARFITEPGNNVFASAGSAWEIAIKCRLGKLDAPSDFEAAILICGFRPLPISMAHARVQDIEM